MGLGAPSSSRGRSSSSTGSSPTGFRVIRFDNRDIGLSTMTRRPPTTRQLILSVIAPRFAKSDYTVDDMADDAAACSTTSASPRPTSSASRWAA